MDAHWRQLVLTIIGEAAAPDVAATLKRFRGNVSAALAAFLAGLAGENGMKPAGCGVLGGSAPPSGGMTRTGWRARRGAGPQSGPRRTP